MVFTPRKKKHLAPTVAAACVVLVGLLVAFGPGGLLVPRERHDFSSMVGAFCAESLVIMRQTPGFEDFAAYGFPAVAMAGDEPTFLYPARSWRGAYIVRVQGRCAVPERCTFVEAVQDSEGRVVYTGS